MYDFVRDSLLYYTITVIFVHYDKTIRLNYEKEDRQD